MIQTITYYPHNLKHGEQVRRNFRPYPSTSKKKYEGSIKIIYIIFMLTLFINLLKRKVTQSHII